MGDRGRKILVTGGTGTLGSAFTELAGAAGHRVRVMSRREPPDDLPPEREWARADVATGEGLEEALRGVEVVLHAASDSTGDPDAVEVVGTRRLLAASADSNAGSAKAPHLVYPSVVGIDRMPYPYYDTKLKAEELIVDSGGPHTIVRITQFHSFVDDILSFVGKLPVLLLPTRARVQSIAVEDAAAHLLARIEEGASGRTPDVAGPEVLTLGEMARSWARIRGKRRWIVRLPIPGDLARGFREGRATVPDRAVGTETWREWLGRTHGSSVAPTGRRRDP